MKRTLAAILPSATALALVLVSPAFAQDQDNTESTTSAAPTGIQEIEVVATGTLIRGVAPQASQVIGLDPEDIEATGVTSTADLLSKVPQIAGFNQLPGVQAVNQVEVSASTVNLRQLPGAGGTLLLLDGHRLPGAGIKQTEPDPDIVPPFVLQRVEAVPDGGASLYGADAVGGVVNLITRKSFDGVKVGAQYGHAPQYDEYSFNGIVGKDWGSGSAYAAYNYSYHDALFGRDRDFVQRLDWATGQPLDLTCVPGNILANGTTYALPGVVANTANRCDTSDTSTWYNDDTRHSGFVSLSQDFGSRVSFDLKAWYTHRERNRDVGVRTSTAVGLPFNPFYVDTGDANSGALQTVFVNFGPLLGYSDPSTNVFKVWGVTPSVTVDLPHDWELRMLLNYGEGKTEVSEGNFDPVDVGIALALGAGLNAWDPASSPPGATAFFQHHLYGKSTQKIANAKAVFDGPLFKLPGPGGDVKAAIGTEFIYEEYKARSGSVYIGDEMTLPLGGGSRDTYSVFSELNIPIVDDGSTIPGLYGLGLSISGRFDSYTDFGDTLNPRVGANYKPAEWLNLRGTWSTSYTAPSLSVSRAPDNTSFNIPATILPPPIPPFPPIPPGARSVGSRGGVPGVQPQTATIYSAGFDYTPPELDGLKLSMTYYHILYEDLIGIPPVQNQSFFLQFPDLFLILPTEAEALALVAGNPDAEAAVHAAFLGGAQPYSVIDGRKRNLGSSKLSGIDFSGDYRHDVSYGDFFVNLGGTYRLTREDSAKRGAPFVDVVKENVRLEYAATVGTDVDTNIGTFLAQATLNYRGGFTVEPNSGNNFQNEVDPFKTVDFFFKYDVAGEGFLTNGLSFTAALRNAFNEEPSTYMGIFGVIRDGYANGETVGRLFQFGIDKKF